MAVKFKDVENIEYNRKIEIIERTVFIKNKFKHLLESKGSYGISYLIQTLYYQYRKFYKDDLTDEEQVLFNVYTVFHDDEVFNNLIKRFNKDYSKIGKLYGITEPYVKIRHYISISIENEKKNIKTLDKKPN